VPAHPTAPAFVVEGFGGPVGVITAKAVAAVPATERSDRRLAGVMLALRDLPTVTPDTDAGVLASRLPGPVLAVRDRAGTWFGVLLARDLAVAARTRAALPLVGWVPPDPATRVG
jgi:hypothetical protein